MKFLNKLIGLQRDDHTACYNYEKMQLLNDLNDAKLNMEAAYANFDYATDPAMIDSSIYEVNAILKRYKYLLEEVTKLNSQPESTTYCLNEETTTITPVLQINT